MVEAGVETSSGGDVPDWDNTDSSAGEEAAAWRDLVARFDAPPTAQQPVPWPAREEWPETQDPDVIQTRLIRGATARPMAGRTPASGMPADDDDDDHFIPPVPPPLPRLDPLAKGAWAALFGGPGYLLVATSAGWPVSGLAVLCAVAAFVAGFATLVLRMNEPGPGGPDDGDNGAVV